MATSAGTAWLNANEYWLDLQRYPATLLLYALGLGAIEAITEDAAFNWLESLRKSIAHGSDITSNTPVLIAAITLMSCCDVGFALAGR